MTHYMIAKIEIVDREEYARYEAGFMEIFSRYGGQMLAVDEDVRLLEGEWPATRTVLIAFDSAEDALDWYQSEDYQQLAKHRLKASDADLVLIQGLPA